VEDLLICEGGIALALTLSEVLSDLGKSGFEVGVEGMMEGVLEGGQCGQWREAILYLLLTATTHGSFIMLS
jgi:hypothetical protein